MIVHLIEDDDAVLDALALVLEELGHEVSCFRDAEAFFDNALPDPADLVIVDLGLPGAGGDDVIIWLRNLSSPPRILAISGKPKAMLDNIEIDLASLTLLRKPLSVHQLTGYFGSSAAHG